MIIIQIIILQKTFTDVTDFKIKFFFFKLLKIYLKSQQFIQ